MVCAASLILGCALCRRRPQPRARAARDARWRRPPRHGAILTKRFFTAQRTRRDTPQQHHSTHHIILSGSALRAAVENLVQVAPVLSAQHNTPRPSPSPPSSHLSALRAVVEHLVRERRERHYERRVDARLDVHKVPVRVGHQRARKRARRGKARLLSHARDLALLAVGEAQRDVKLLGAEVPFDLEVGLGVAVVEEDRHGCLCM